MTAAARHATTRRRGFGPRLLLFFCVLVGLSFGARRANAYPWMVRHGYTQCATCHADPAGGGLLNSYGRAQGEILMRMRYGSPPTHEPTRTAEPVWGLLPELPRGLLVGGATRWARIEQKTLGRSASGRFIVMQADLLAQYKLGRVRANASVGYVSEGANAALLSPNVADVVSRVHWIGIDLGATETVLFRAGRMNIPYGIRSIEHTMFTRVATRSDINAAQQHGVSLDLHDGSVRASLMGIAGNFQLEEDSARSRGYAALAEYAFAPTLAAGLASTATRAERDPALLASAWRQAHGTFVRYSPFREAVVSAEFDFLHVARSNPDATSFGGVGMLNVDLEPVQGFHFSPTLEVLVRDFGERASYGAWMTAWWFFAPHTDLRLDAIGQRLSFGGATANAVAGVLQVHMYL